jgi:phosphatidylserine synthase
VLVRDALSPWSMTFGTLAVAVTMISTLKVPKFRKGDGLPIPMMLLGLGLYVAFLIRPGVLTWHAWNTFNIIILITNYIFLARRREAPVEA